MIFVFDTFHGPMDFFFDEVDGGRRHDILAFEVLELLL
jgi:hypothetical protein